MPAYDANSWNDNGDVKSSSNCYDYAVDAKRTGRKPEDPTSKPGRKAGKSIGKAPYSCDDVKKGVAADGGDKVKECKKDTKCDENCWKIAVLLLDDLDKGLDYHFVRQDSDSKWSHKMGGGEVNRNDSNGNEIKDPESAEFWIPYKGRDKVTYKFCAYFCFCPGIEVASLAPKPGGVFAVVSLRETATLSTPTFDLSVPPGEYTLLYGHPPRHAPSVPVELLMFSGENNPLWVLTLEEIDLLRAKISGLPVTHRRPANPTGNRGFVIYGDSWQRLPDRIHVLDGTVAIQTFRGETQWFEDIHQLETWLLSMFDQLPIARRISQLLDTEAARN